MNQSLFITPSYICITARRTVLVRPAFLFSLPYNPSETSIKYFP